MHELKSAEAIYGSVLLSDIAGSSRLAETNPHEDTRALLQHNTLIEQDVSSHGGGVDRQLNPERTA